MIQTNTPCRHCGESMIETEFARHFRCMCNNFHCPLYRECQGIREKEIDLAPIMAMMPAPLTSHAPLQKVRKKTVRRKGMVYDRKAF